MTGEVVGRISAKPTDRMTGMMDGKVILVEDAELGRKFEDMILGLCVPGILVLACRGRDGRVKTIVVTTLAARTAAPGDPPRS